MAEGAGYGQQLKERVEGALSKRLDSPALWCEHQAHQGARIAPIVLLQISFADSGVPRGIQKARVAFIAPFLDVATRECKSDREEGL